MAALTLVDAACSAKIVTTGSPQVGPGHVDGDVVRKYPKRHEGSAALNAQCVHGSAMGVRACPGVRSSRCSSPVVHSNSHAFPLSSHKVDFVAFDHNGSTQVVGTVAGVSLRTGGEPRLGVGFPVDKLGVRTIGSRPATCVDRVRARPPEPVAFNPARARMPRRPQT